ncbi:unnamed protein product, partial [Brugia pahangi]|uniref:Uncharacterized protein n=1 Tax=Brugia pahangi TaxID=6280 RepID=A0A0N4T4H5_BRUPA
MRRKNSQHRAAVYLDTGETLKMDSSSISISKTEGTEGLTSTNIISQEATARNYASKECGAKVLFSNDEAENKNAVLNEKEAVDYMRNPCERAE